MGEPHVVSLRATRDTDLDTLNLITRDAGDAAGTPGTPGTPGTAGTPGTPGAPGTDHRTIRADGEIVGDVSCWLEAGLAFVGCRVDDLRRDDGIAGRALRLFLEALDQRPVRARVAAGDVGSILVLERLGFEQDDAVRPGVATEPDASIDELVFLLA